MGFKIKEIFIYPIKSFKGIQIKVATALLTGFEYDRRWMLIDFQNRFISQREFPVLSQFNTKLDKGFLTIIYNQEEVTFDTELMINNDISATVWDDTAIVNEVNENISDWLSERIGMKCKLVKIKDEFSRLHKSSKLDKSIPMSLADGYPYLVIGDKSLEFLNSKLAEPVEMNRFRPNIVIETEFPHQEDELDTLKFENVEFQNVKPCGRCIMINTNQDTSEVKKEPLKTLSTYRKFENSVHFGSNFICVKEGKLEF